MKILFDGKEVGGVFTDSNINKEEALCYAFGLSEIDNQKELEKLYENNDFVSFEDGIYFLSVTDFEFIY